MAVVPPGDKKKDEMWVPFIGNHPDPGERKPCDHKFIGSTKCVKCGWSPK